MNFGVCLNGHKLVGGGRRWWETLIIVICLQVRQSAGEGLHGGFVEGGVVAGDVGGGFERFG